MVVVVMVTRVNLVLLGGYGRGCGCGVGGGDRRVFIGDSY